MLSTVKLWRKLLTKAAISSLLKCFFWYWKMGSMLSCLSIIALYTVYTQQLADENKDCHSVLILTELWYYRSLLKRVRLYTVGIVKLTSSEQKCDEWVLILISNLSKLLCLKVTFVININVLKSLRKVFLNTFWIKFQFILQCLAYFNAF